MNTTLKGEVKALWPSTYVCVPRLTIPDLFLIILECRRCAGVRFTVWYSELGTALKVLTRLGVAPRRITDAAGWLAPNAEFVAIEHDVAIESYPRVHAEALETTTDVILGYLSEIEQDSQVPLGGGLLGREAILSFLAKTLARDAVFPAVLALKACAARWSPSRLALWLPLSWPVDLGAAVAARLSGVDVLAPQSPTRRLFRWFLNVLTAVRVGWSVLRSSVRRGITLRSPVARAWQLAIEFIDAAHLSGRPHDSDGVVDGNRVDTSRVLVFLTHRQTRTLRSVYGRSCMQAVHQTVRNRGYALAVLDECPYPFAWWKKTIWWMGRIMADLILSQPTAARTLMPEFAEDYMDFASLFLWHKPECILYFSLPYGMSSFRTNSGVVSGLARINGAVSAGLQTRSAYLRSYEYCFDCHDIYFFWGPRYAEFLHPAGTRFVTRHYFVGCTHISPTMVTKAGIAGRQPQTPPTVLAFTGDVALFGVAVRHHHTYTYTRQFLKLLVRFSKEHLRVTVQVKFKDPVGLEYFGRDAVIGKDLTSDRPPNLHMRTTERDVYQSDLVAADVVVAMGFTSPATDALLLGKPVVFYSQFGNLAGHFLEIPDLVATDDEQFLVLLRRAITDPNSVRHAQQPYTTAFDPFRDGFALDRVASYLWPKGVKETAKMLGGAGVKE